MRDCAGAVFPRSPFCPLHQTSLRMGRRTRDPRLANVMTSDGRYELEEASGVKRK